jgi:phosphate starvation-inducible protein PhoH and related proteins
MGSEEGGHPRRSIRIEPAERTRALMGRRDLHLRLLRDAFDIRVAMRGGSIFFDGEDESVNGAIAAVKGLLGILDRKPHLSIEEVEQTISDARRDHSSRDYTSVDVFPPRRSIQPRTDGQAAYLKSILTNDVVFCVGPAGSGKTYLAVAAAVQALKHDQVRKIILTRPAVEAGEKLGFLPGDLQAKVNPYLRPLYDALQDMMGLEQMRRYMETDLLEVAPLAYMRGRTLDRAFIILDEAQNCTRRQMKMFLTRLGASSRCVVTGDVSQIDLPPSEVSGMIEAMHVLRKVKGIGFARLSQVDIVRHRLVQSIVNAYEADEESSAR